VKSVKNRKILKRKFFGERKSTANIEKLLLKKNIWEVSNQKNFIDIL
jgi:hypothetical protein